MKRLPMIPSLRAAGTATAVMFTVAKLAMSRVTHATSDLCSLVASFVAEMLDGTFSIVSCSRLCPMSTVGCGLHLYGCLLSSCLVCH